MRYITVKTSCSVDIYQFIFYVDVSFSELLGQTQSGATSEASERQDDEAEQEEDYLPELPEEDEESLLICKKCSSMIKE